MTDSLKRKINELIPIVDGILVDLLNSYDKDSILISGVILSRLSYMNESFNTTVGYLNLANNILNRPNTEPDISNMEEAQAYIKKIMEDSK